MKFTLRSAVIVAATAFALATTVALEVLLAQEPGARRGGTGITSPEVAPDRRVIFRLHAPAAKKVTVSGDFGNDVDLRAVKTASGLRRSARWTPRCTSTTSPQTVCA